MSRFSLLVFHRAVGFVHQSIPDTVEAIEKLGAEHGFDVATTDDPADFTDERLSEIDVVVFAHTTGNVVPERSQREALERFVGHGGGFFGIHAASSMAENVRDDWPWYVELVGAEFKGHTAGRWFCDKPFESRPDGAAWGGPIAAAPDEADLHGPEFATVSWVDGTIHVEQPACGASRGLVDGDTYTDEWYGFEENPRPWVEIVATVDESTFIPFKGEMGDDHPIIWWREFGGGRTVYNSMGHTKAIWSEPWFLESILGGIELAAGVQ
jgi:type 1 glutamine amidotransferase